jgi:hypothetical protein
MYNLTFDKKRTTRGRCYDHNFLQFSTIFGEKLAFFSKTNVMIKFLPKLAVVYAKKAKFFSPIFFAKIFYKIATSVTASQGEEDFGGGDFWRDEGEKAIHGGRSDRQIVHLEGPVLQNIYTLWISLLYMNKLRLIV